MKQRLLAGLCVLGLMTGSSSAVVSEMTPPPEEETVQQNQPSADYIASAHILYELGLLKGSQIGTDGTPDFDLESKCTRAEAAVLIVRLLGKEEQAKQAPSSPFIDLQDWQKPAVNYLYQEGIVSADQANRFEPEATCTAQMYTTMLLRALGYSEKEKDFTFESSIAKAMQIGLIDNFSCDLQDFRRDDAVQMNRMALEVAPKGQNQDLLALLVESNVVPAQKAQQLRIQEQKITQLKEKTTTVIPYQAKVFAAILDRKEENTFSIQGTLIEEKDRARFDGIFSIAMNRYAVSQPITVVRDSSGITISQLRNDEYRDDQIATFLRQTGILSLIMSAMPARSLIGDIQVQGSTYQITLPDGSAQLVFDGQGVPQKRNLSMMLYEKEYLVEVQTEKSGNEIKMELPSDYGSYIKLTNTPFVKIE